MAADFRRLAELGMIPSLAKEVAAAINAGTVSAIAVRRLTENSMTPREIRELRNQLANPAMRMAKRWTEIGVSPRLARELVSQVGGGVAPVITLNALGLSNSNFTTGTPSNASITNATSGSSISSGNLPSGFTINSAARQLVYDGTGSANTASITFVEILAGATNSGRQTVAPVTVAASGGGGTGNTGDAMSFRTAGPTIIEPDANGKGIFANGWTAEMVFKGLTPNANVNMFDGQQVTIVVSDPGYSSSGAVIPAVPRTIKGTIALRRPYPNFLQRQVTASGTDLFVRFALDKMIYQGTTIQSVTVGSGVYAGATSVTVPAGSITNSSTRPYPKPFFVWLNRQFERGSGSTFRVEADVAHRYGRNGQMVACVEYTATDGTNTSAVQRVSAPALSTIQTQGNIVESWGADIALSALTQGVQCKVNAKVYPWIGDSTAILDTATAGLVWPTPLQYQPLQFLNDKTGAYGGAFAYVKVGATGGTVSTDATAARAAPFPTVRDAFLALVTFNNTNKGHADHSGSNIRLMDDGAGGTVAHGHLTTVAAAAGLTWTTIEKDPLNTAAVTFSATNASGVANLPDLIAFGNGVRVIQNPNSAGNLYNAQTAATTTARISFEAGSVLDATGATGYLVNGFGYQWHRNNTLKNDTGTSVAQRFFRTTSNTSVAHNVLALGVVAKQAAFGNNHSMIGCQLNECGVGEPSGYANSTFMAPDGAIYHNNTWMNVTAAIATAFGSFTWGKDFDYPVRGLAFVQNVYEHVGATGGGLWNVGADDMIKTICECLDIHNTAMGNRGNWLYSDISTSAGIEKRGPSRYSLWLSKPTKTDVFAGGDNNTPDAPAGRGEGVAAAGATGNWEWAYQVESEGTVCLLGAANESSGTITFGADPNGAKWQGMYWQPSSVPTLHQGTAYPSATFVSDKVGWNGAGGPGGTGGLSDFHITGTTSPLYNRVPAGSNMLKYALDGALRRTDGTGACGAYERTV
jgi:hypothetical protein